MSREKLFEVYEKRGYFASGLTAHAVDNEVTTALPGPLENTDIQAVLKSQFDLDVSDLCGFYFDKNQAAAAPTVGFLRLKNSQERSRGKKIGAPSNVLTCVIDAFAGQQIESAVQRFRHASAAVVDADYAVSFAEEAAYEEAAKIIAETIVFELGLAAEYGFLTVDSGDLQHSTLFEFLSNQEWHSYLSEKYPLLVRRLQNRLRLVFNFIERFVARIIEDLPLIANMLNAEAKLLKIAAVARGAGDSHAGGASVCIITFECQRKVVYKPRCLSPEVCLNSFLAKLGAWDARLTQRTPWILQREEYGWVEFVDQLHLENRGGIEAYHFRYGALMCAMYLLNGTDIHHENLICHGEFPVVIDAETIFQPTRLMGDSGAEASFLLDLEFFCSTPLYTAMIDPVGIDDVIRGGPLSTIVGRAGEEWIEYSAEKQSFSLMRQEIWGSGQHNAVINGTVVNGHDYHQEILNGYASCYETALRHKEELLSSVFDDLAQGLKIRSIFKPTMKYAKMLGILNSPYSNESTFKQDELLAKLWLPAVSKPKLSKIVAFEMSDLWDGDVPYFSAKAHETSAYSSTGECISDLYNESGLQVAKSKLARLTLGSMQSEVEMLRYVLRRRQEAGEKRGESPEKDDGILARAKPLEILGLIARNATLDGGSTVMSDLQIDQDGGTRPLPLKSDFYSGSGGVAFSLCYASRMSKNEAFNERASLVLRNHFNRRDLFDTQDVGVCHGIGGSIYLASHAASVFSSSGYGEIGLELANFASQRLHADRKFDLFSGAAGLLMSLCAIFHVTKNEKIREYAHAACRHLEKYSVDSSFGGTVWMSSIPSSGPTTGFAHGISGIAYALLSARETFQWTEFDELIHGANKFLEARHLAPGQWAEDDTGEISKLNVWCHGASGIGAFYELYDRVLGIDDRRSRFVLALKAMADCVEYENDSACHGTLGNLDILLYAMESDRWRDVRMNLGIEEKVAVIRNSFADSRQLKCGNKYHHHSVSLFNGRDVVPVAPRSRHRVVPLIPEI